MNYRFFLALLLLSKISFADTSNDNNTLPNMVVTATRSSQQLNELSSAVTVYRRADIERLQAKTLPDLLKGSLGLDMAQSGGAGQPTSFFLRGTNSSHVLVFIDGIKVGSVTAGTTPFELISIDQIERVEISRGPYSSLYGSEAIGGVIQIFTHKAQRTDDNTPHFSLESGGGSYNSAKVAGNVSGNWNKAWYNLGVSHLTSDGINATKPTSSNFNPDHDGYDNTGMNARAGYRFDRAELSAFFLHNEGDNYYDNGLSDASANDRRFIEQVVGVQAEMQINTQWHSLLRLGQSRDESRNLTPQGTVSGRYDATRWNLSWQNEWQINADHQVILGTDYRVDEIDSNVNYQPTSRYDVGGFAEFHSRLFDKHFFTGSIRYDENQAFGDYVTGSIGWRYNSDWHISPFAHFGNAFKSPTFSDLYGPADWGSNPNLQPEQSQSVEVGLAGQHRFIQWEIRAYHTDIDHLIAWRNLPTPPAYGILENVDKARIQGIETEIKTELFNWHINLTLSLLDPRDLSHHTRLLRRTDKSLSFNLSRSFDTFECGTTVIAQNARDDFYYDKTTFQRINTQVDGFVTVDLYGAYHFNKNWAIRAKLNNLFNEDYQTVYGYNNMGQNFFVTLNYTH